MRAYFLLSATILVALSAQAAAADPEPKIVINPPALQETAATIDSPIYTTTAYYPMMGAVRAGALKAGSFDIGPEYGMLMSSAKDQIKACLIYEGRLAGVCAVDEDSNGTFDKIGGKRLEPSVSYEQREVPDPRHATIQNIYLYAGATSDSLRLTYREVTNERYRPGLDQEFSIPLGKTFPQQVAIKNLKMTILSIDGMGIRYRIER
jgi:hypothetical protein